MFNSLEVRLMRLEAQSNLPSRKILVVGDEAELEACKRAGDIAADTIVIVTGVPRPRSLSSSAARELNLLLRTNSSDKPL